MESSFTKACTAVLSEEHKRDSIGVLSERTLHAVLKQYYAADGFFQEVKVGRYIADLASPDEIIEIQTANFARLRSKLTAFLADRPVTVVYPIAAVKWLFRLDPETGEILQKRKSPKKGSVCDAFFELYKIRDFLQKPNLRFCFVLLELNEYRGQPAQEYSKRSRRDGSSRLDRIPLSILEEITIRCPADYRKLLPKGLLSVFTAKQFAEASRMTPRKVWYALQVLLSVGLIEQAGMQGRAFVYQICSSQQPDAFTEIGCS